jgi:hypothetical protein
MIEGMIYLNAPTVKHAKTVPKVNGPGPSAVFKYNVTALPMKRNTPQMTAGYSIF